LRSIADEKEAFYKGWIAKKIVQEVRQAGVPIELEDMALFEPEWCEPLRCSYNGASIFEVAPNSMGATTLLILKLLEKERLDGVPPDSLARMQKTLGAVKTAYARRDRRLADPRFVPFSLKDFLRVGSSTGSRRGTPAFPSSADTTFFAIADKEGNLLSCVQSLFSHFGSKSFLHELGFFLNNRASGFEMEGPNGVESRKRPLNTLSALIIARSGKPEIALGCSGGNFRPQQHALFVTNLFDYSMDLERSISFPRFLLSDSEVMVERGYSGVRSLGGKIRILPYPGPTGVAHGIDCAKNRKLGVADFRGGGAPHGD
jgi:gamma-glutamyltranspeptidase/glutathione hydrolase